MHKTKTFGRRMAAVLGAVLAVLVLGTAVPTAIHPAAPAVPADFAGSCLLPGEAVERVASVETCGDALLWRLRLIASAKKELEFTCFQWKDDETGRAVMSALAAAADRGVRVRILLDGFNAELDLTGSRALRALAERPNVELRIYTPISLLRPWTIQTRMHDKYLIADDTAFLLGGRNTYDRFLKDSPGASEDRELLVWQQTPGPDSALLQLQKYFESVWNLPETKSWHPAVGAGDQAGRLRALWAQLTAQEPLLQQTPDWAALTLPADRVTLLSNPVGSGVKKPVLWAQLCALMGLGGDVLIETPYAVCGDAMKNDLRTLTGAGIPVTVLTNSPETGANPFGCADLLNQRKSLVGLGVTVCEYAGARSSHTKTVLVGDSLSVVGSFNLDMRSTYLDTELMLAVASPRLNAQLRAEAAVRLDASRQNRPDGTVVCGPAFAPAPLKWTKRVLYALLRVVSLPIRHLL